VRSSWLSCGRTSRGPRAGRGPHSACRYSLGLGRGPAGWRRLSRVYLQHVCEAAAAHAKDLDRALETGQRLAELLTGEWTSAWSLSWPVSPAKTSTMLTFGEPLQSLPLPPRTPGLLVQTPVPFLRDISQAPSSPPMPCLCPWPLPWGADCRGPSSAGDTAAGAAPGACEADHIRCCPCPVEAAACCGDRVC
jgi:hypothetical protein